MVVTPIESTRLIWHAAGDPEPCDTKGQPIPSCRGAGHCARCGSPDGVHSIAQLVSQNFLPIRNANRLSPHGGWRYCPACMFSAKALRLRCISWFASDVGVRFYRTRAEEKGERRPNALAELLSPPKPPFVAGLPLYGIAHGGENNWRRCWWPDEPLPESPLIKLQSKHVALYSRTAYSRDRYPVQIDDDRDIVVDRDAWLFARDDANALMGAMIDDGLKPWVARKSLTALAYPAGASPALARLWPRLTRPLVPYVSTTWWPIFCSLIPELEEREDEETGEGTDPRPDADGHQGNAPTAGVPAEGNTFSHEHRQARGAPLQADPQRAFDFARSAGSE